MTKRTCAMCQPERGWWHKIWQRCKKCGGWPMAPDPGMALAKTGGEYYATERERQVAEAVTQAASTAFHPTGGEATKLEVIVTCSALVTYFKTLGEPAMAAEIENLRIKLGRDE